MHSRGIHGGFIGDHYSSERRAGSKKIIAFASMLGTARDEMICDYAEYYHLYDIDSIPIPLAATLASGLPQKSRTMMKLAGIKISLDELLMALSVDGINTLCWMTAQQRSKTPVARPKSVADLLTNKKQESAEKYMVFDSADAFEHAREAILEKLKEEGKLNNG